VRREAGPDGRGQLYRAVDDSRDQSYFLFATTQAQLDFLRFPLGALPKTETRALAERFDLPVAAKPDSQDICFVPNGSYARVVERLRPGALDGGEIVDLEGRVLGSHDGIVNYTIGQRRGLGIGGAGDPLYVVAIEPETRRVVVGPHSALARDVVRVGEVNWLDGAPLGIEPRAVQVKLRNTQPPVEAEVVGGENGAAEIFLERPQHGVSPGQAAVFYDGERVLGGGWIGSAELRAAA
jgi:tRNA-specific 2-thiouridylase